jgi:hypothetical protein
MEPNIGELLASTDEKRTKKPADLVANASLLYYMLKEKGRVTEDLEGRAIYEEFAYAQNNAYQAIDATQKIDLDFNNTLDAFVYTPKQSVVPVMISELEKAQNRGQYAVLNLIKERGKIGETTMINEIASDLNLDGTGRSGKAFAGIKTYVTDTPTSGSVGGASRATTTAIRNVASNLKTTYGSDTSAANIEDRVLALKNQIYSPGMEYFGYAGSEFYRYGAEALRGRSRLVNEKLKAAGFGDHIILEGIPFCLAGGFNPQGGSVIAEDRFYILCADAFKFRTYKGYNMQALPNRVSTRQLVDVALRLCIGQFTCSDPARNAVGFDS